MSDGLTDTRGGNEPRKFKIGEAVEVIHNTSGHDLEIGEEYDIDGYWDEGYYVSGWFVPEGDLERAKTTRQKSYWEDMRGKTVKSDGGPSSYYDFPEGFNTLNDLIEYKEMSFAQGNILKAAYRLGRKDGITLEYDLKKIKYYADRMLNQLREKT